MQAFDGAKPRGAANTPRYDPARQGATAATVSDAAAYNPDADVTADAAGKAKKVCSGKASCLCLQWYCCGCIQACCCILRTEVMLHLPELPSFKSCPAPP